MWRILGQSKSPSPEPYIHIGLLEARLEHYNEAIAAYRKAIAMQPADAALRLNLGLALFKSSQFAEAARSFESARKLFPPDSPDIQRIDILLGMAHYGLREYATAAPYLKKAAAKDPQNLELRLVLAHSCLWSKQYQCVLDVYREMLLLNPDSAEADMLAGEAQDGLKNRSGAIEQFRAAVKADPRLPEVHFGLGYLLWTQHQYEEAVSEFNAELANNPNHVQARVYLGDAHLQMSRPDLAQPVLEDVTSRDPSVWLAHLDLGIIYADSGRQKDALTEMQKAASIAPGEVNTHWRLGKLYRSMGRNEEAQAEFAKARSLHTAEDQDLLHKMSPAAAVADKPTGPGSP
ncbi:tetratricopeptide repeat protein [Occallatibacter riparius]|uniref:Tetratricopeptide repeat protein n=1 Tax=Occallatibacter riparius TaxID=1002689 RepID=A0A9J7BP92_9BACT|nr:tetratricopeptide repeat protein [Occallatibacter riparius]UWZ84345.1 tetratricopeptide repeat protein [Occallatibacter riparius]